MGKKLFESIRAQIRIPIHQQYYLYLFCSCCACACCALLAFWSEAWFCPHPAITKIAPREKRPRNSFLVCLIIVRPPSNRLLYYAYIILLIFLFYKCFHKNYHFLPSPHHYSTGEEGANQLFIYWTSLDGDSDKHTLRFCLYLKK